ncbi:MAG: hypothetical protein ACOYNL_10120 [Rickettsiales bacterium]
MIKSEQNRHALMEGILRKEGGYSSEANRDPETLFGITVNNWVTAIPKLPPEQIATAPKAIKAHFSAITSAGAKPEGKVNAASFMREIGYLLDPIGKKAEHPQGGLPLRSNEHPRPGLTPEEHATLEAARNIAKNILFEKYAREPKFSEYPAVLGDQVIRSSINCGAPRALWATWKSLFEAGAIDEKTYLKLPPLTSSEVIAGKIFAGSGKGQPYTTRETQRMVADAVNNATEQQINVASNRFPVWQNTYYKVLIANSPRFGIYEDGWKNAVKSAHSEATGQKSIQYTNTTLSSTPATKDSDALNRLIANQTAKLDPAKDTAAAEKLLASLVTKENHEAAQSKSLRFPVTDSKSPTSQTTQLASADKPRTR